MRNFYLYLSALPEIRWEIRAFWVIAIQITTTLAANSVDLVTYSFSNQADQSNVKSD
jgi:hypothetical protein